jgi:MFS family permease
MDTRSTQPGTSDSRTRWQASAAAVALVGLTSGSTSTSAVFGAYRAHWGLSPADIGLAFSVYVATLIPVLLLFGGLAERLGRRPVIIAGMLFMASGTLTLVFAHGLAQLIAARLLQGLGAALAVSAISATFTEAYRGKIVAGQALSVVTAFALSMGPLVTAIAFDLGGGPNLSYLPVLIGGLAVLALTPFFTTRAERAGSPAAVESPLPESVVRAGLWFAMPVVFTAWASTSLYLSLVPSYLDAALHATDPLIGAGAFLATQVATVAASIRFGNVVPEKSALIGTPVMLAGLALLVLGTQTNQWALIGLATLMVGAGAGVASGAAFAIANRIGRGRRAAVFARVLVAAYLGYSLPSFATGLIAAMSSFTIAFVTIIAVLGLIAALLPLLGKRYLTGVSEPEPVLTRCLAA